MTIKLLTIGKTDNAHLETLMNDYQSRLNHYIKFELEIIPDLKKVKHLLIGVGQIRDSKIRSRLYKLGKSLGYKFPKIQYQLRNHQLTILLKKEK